MSEGVRFDVSHVTAGLDKICAGMRGVSSRALKRTGTTVRAYMARAIADDTGLGSTRVKQELFVKVPDDSRLQVICRGQRIPLIYFKARALGARGTGRGVSYVDPGAGRDNLPHGFIATMQNGHRGVFERSRFGRKGARFHKVPVLDKRTGRVYERRREVIEEKFGPSLPHVFLKFAREGQAAGRDALVKNLRHELMFAFGSGDGEFPLKPIGPAGPSPEE